MKRLAFLIGVIWLVVLFSGMAVLAGSSQVRHRDPASVPEKTEMDAILLAYASVLDRVSLKNYQDAQSRLGEIGSAAIPGEWRYLAQRANALGQELITSLDGLEGLLNEISQLITGYQLAAAEGELDEAREAVLAARRSLDDLEGAVSALSDRAAFRVLTGSRLGQAFEGVEESLARLKTRLELTESWQAKMREGLIATSLSLDVNPSSVFWDESITVSGKLSGGGTSPGERDLILRLGGRSRSVTTGPDGSYSLAVSIPTGITANMTVMAVYRASGDDLGTYLSSQSPPVTVRVNYYPTRLEVTAPEVALPGATITVNGRVSAAGASESRTVALFWDESPLLERVVQGEFSLDILPSSVSVGEHNLEVVVLPEGRYGGASRRLPVTLMPGTLSAEIEAPGVAFVPQLIRVSGRVEHELGPLGKARVELALGSEVTTVRTEADGSFRASVLAPLDLSLAGPQEIDITILPDEPWFDPLRVRESLIMVSPAIMAFLVLLSVIFMVWMIMRPPGITVPVSPEGMVLSEPPGSETVAVTAPPAVPSRKLAGIRGEALSLYFDAVEIVTRVSGISPEPHTTLREYLMAVSRLPGGYKAFSELTGLAELVLYSSHVLEEEVSRRAARLLASIKEELRSDVA